MKILVACDSFKGSLTSLEIGKIVKEELEKKLEEKFARWEYLSEIDRLSKEKK